MTITTDNLVNLVSGMGVGKAKRDHNTFQYSNFNDWQTLDAAFQDNWIARAIVEYPAEDMCREWRTIKCNDADLIRAEEDRLMLPVMTQDAITWSRLYGGASILMLTGQDLTKPLNLNRIRKGDLQRIIVLDRWDMRTGTINTWNVLAHNYLLPEFYTLVGGAQQIHWSHFARFEGAKLPRRQKAQTQGWGDSYLRKCIEDVMDCVAAKNGIAELMQEANIDVIKREGLSDEIASGEEAQIRKRYELFSMMKSVINMALLDGDETLDRQTLSLGGVAPIIEQLMTWISGAADIPVTRLFGTSAKGMNATGEGDMRNYYDSLRSKQLTQVDPGMRTLDEVLVRSALGYWPDDYNYVWNPLQQMNELQAAQAAQARMTTDQGYLDAGVVTVSQVQRNLQANEQYQFDDEAIEEQAEHEDAGMFDEPVEPMDTQQALDAFRSMVDQGLDADIAAGAIGGQ